MLASALPRALEFEGKWHTSGGQVDGIGIDGVVLGGGKAQNERGKQESKRQHVDLVALFNHGVETLMKWVDECQMSTTWRRRRVLMMMLFNVVVECRAVVCG